MLPDRLTEEELEALLCLDLSDDMTWQDSASYFEQLNLERDALRALERKEKHREYEREYERLSVIYRDVSRQLSL